MSRLLFLLLVATSMLLAQVNAPFRTYEKFLCGDPANGPGWGWSHGTNFRMRPQGDGSYHFTNLLVPGQDVIYKFTVRTNPTATLYWEVLWGTTDIANYQARLAGFSPTITGGNRKITIPLWATNTAVLCIVTNNFAEHPKPPDNFTARAWTNEVRLSWDPASSLDKVLDVYRGGKFNIYMSSNAPTGPYSFVASRTGWASTYTQYNLTRGKQYCFLIVSHDAYIGPTWHCSSTNVDTSNDRRCATPRSRVRVIFKVENIDVDKVLSDPNRIVWLTPWEEDGRFYPYKIPAAFAVATIPKHKE